MKDGFFRNIDYLKISLTNKCNLQCAYCIGHYSDFIDENLGKFLSVDDYKFIIKSMSKQGINTIEFTNGDLFLDTLAELVYYAKYQCDIQRVIITTNGSRFYETADKLKQAGLDEINIGINSLKEYRYSSITRVGNLNDVMKSFNTALQLGIKVNIDTIIINRFNDDEIYDFIQVAKNFPVDLRFYELVKIECLKDLFHEGYFDMIKFMDDVEGMSKTISDDNICKNYYRDKSFKGKVGVVSAFDQDYCSGCNKIVLSHDAKLRLCVYSDEEYDILHFLHKPITFSEMLKDIVNYKPMCFDDIKSNLTKREFNEL